MLNNFKFFSFVKAFLFVLVALSLPLTQKINAEDANLKDIYKSVGIVSYKGSLCSAILVSQSTVITSRLCLQEKKIDATKVVFEIIDPSSNVKTKVNGFMFVGSNQFVLNNKNHSWALVKLSSSVPNIFKPVEISSNKINSQYKTKRAMAVGFYLQKDKQQANNSKLNFFIDNSCALNTTDLERNDEENYESMVMQSCNQQNILINGSAVFDASESGKVSLIGLKSGSVIDENKNNVFNLIAPVAKANELLKQLEDIQIKKRNPSNNGLQQNDISNPFKGVEIWFSVLI